jgi:hypothetical protein
MEIVEQIRHNINQNMTAHGYVLPSYETAIHRYVVYGAGDLDAIESAISNIPALSEDFAKLVAQRGLMIDYVIACYHTWDTKYQAIPFWRRWLAKPAPNVYDYPPIIKLDSEIEMICSLLAEARQLETAYIRATKIKNVPLHTFKFEDHNKVVIKLSRYEHLGLKWIFDSDV